MKKNVLKLIFVGSILIGMLSIAYNKTAVASGSRVQFASRLERKFDYLTNMAQDRYTLKMRKLKAKSGRVLVE